MKKIIYSVLTCLVLLPSPAIFAETNAITLNLVSEAGPLDLVALGSARKLIGAAIADGILDAFLVNPLSTHVVTTKKTVFSACLESAADSTPQAFETFVKSLRGIHPKSGTAVKIVVTVGCQKKHEVVAITCGGITDKLCPDNLICIDDPKDDCDPMLGGKDCAGVCNGN
ncbi:MAG: hypothetical protein ABL903_11325 [Methylococcales bacterium]